MVGALAPHPSPRLWSWFAAGGFALAPSVVVGPLWLWALVGLILFMLACILLGFACCSVLLGASPSPPLWFWAPCGADFVCLCLFGPLFLLIFKQITMRICDLGPFR